MVHNIDAAAFQRMVIHGAAAISAQKQPINDLNVFPVPDGDTGTNMSLTIGAAAAEMKKNRYQAVGQAAQGTASALLRGARGNSGVILSLLLIYNTEVTTSFHAARKVIIITVITPGITRGSTILIKVVVSLAPST